MNDWFEIVCGWEERWRAQRGNLVVIIYITNVCAWLGRFETCSYNVRSKEFDTASSHEVEI